MKTSACGMTAAFEIEMNRSDKLTYSASYRYHRDDYDKQAYGLNYDVTSTVYAQVSYFAKENAYFYADYSREQQQYGYKGPWSLDRGSGPAERHGLLRTVSFWQHLQSRHPSEAGFVSGWF
jgi:hypothetical protein